MSDDAGIADSLPPQRDDEPPDLRRDIIDELNDHLECAARQEMLSGKDEDEAQYTALERFGDLKTIACQLWWDAMKEQIMKKRLMWGLGITASVMVILFCAFTLFSMFEIVRTLREVQASQANLVPPASPVDLEWGSLTIDLLDENGKPMADWPVTVAGNMYSTDARIKRDLRADENGQLNIDPIRTGTAYDIFTDGKYGWNYFANDIFLEPGESKVLTVNNPVKPDTVPAVFDFIWPDIPPDQTLRIMYRFQSMQPDKSETEWYQSECIIAVEDGAITSVELRDPITDMYSSIDVPTGNILLLPVGVYRMIEARVRYQDAGADTQSPYSRIFGKYPTDENRQVTFKVNAGDESTIDIPLPDNMVNIIDNVTAGLKKD